MNHNRTKFNIFILLCIILLFVSSIIAFIIVLLVFEHLQGEDRNRGHGGAIYIGITFYSIFVYTILSFPIFCMNDYVIRNRKIVNYFCFSGLPIVAGLFFLSTAEDGEHLNLVKYSLIGFLIIQLIIWYYINRQKKKYFPDEN